MTVSRALGSRPRVAEATREKILRAARRLGYTPDPEIAKLMHHLRQRRTRRFQSVICGITTRPEDDPEPYFRAVARGAADQAKRRGYGFTLLHLATGPVEWHGVERMLHGRGVEGVLLLPQIAPIDLSSLLQWEHFSAVAATASVTAPAVHRVTPHHFANTVLLCRHLTALGCHRIGLVMPADHDLRVGHGFTAAFEWHGRHEAGKFLLPMIYPALRTADFERWFRSQRPDAIITHERDAATDVAQRLRRMTRNPVRLAVASLIGETAGAFSGIDEGPAEIGAAAIDQLASMIERRARGLPTAPTTTMLTGRWVE